MRLLEFNVSELAPIVDHAASATKQRQTFYEAENDLTPAKGLFLVKDQGVYIMSNGTNPGDKSMSELGLIAYAKGCHPKVDEGWWETAWDICGGDDFCEFIALDWVQFAMDAGTKLIIEMSDTEIRLRSDLMQET